MKARKRLNLLVPPLPTAMLRKTSERDGVSLSRRQAFADMDFAFYTLMVVPKSWHTKLGKANNLLCAFTCQSIPCETAMMTALDPAPHFMSDDRHADLRDGAFQGVSEAQRNELAEDYVELIAELIHDQGEARPVDIAARLGVKVPTVSKTLDRLAREGLITRAKYRPVFLTEDGRALAQECRRRHEIVLRFLISLGLDPETAERDAEGIEHHVSARTLALFAAFVARN